MTEETMNSMTKGTIFTAGSLGDLPDSNQWPIWFTPKLILIINHACRRFITRYAKGVDGKIVQRFYRALRDAWLRGYMTTIEAWAEFYVFVAHFHRHYLL